MDLGLFKEFCQEVHRKSDVMICITTGGAPTMTHEERMVAVKKFKPELASINMGSINFGLFPMMDNCIGEYFLLSYGDGCPPSMPADLQMVQPDPSLPKEPSAFFGNWEEGSAQWEAFVI